ncbi:IS1 family transposase [Xenorhabdus nematophila]|uniref:IS1 family transposase n=1 Tax=Xenorhabdus nematophila TaxID=628 RepID=UPI0009DC438C
MKKTPRCFMALLEPFNIVFYITDGWQDHDKKLVGKPHVVSERYTQPNRKI